MGVRSAQRQIAKARLKVMGVGNINRKLSVKKDGVPAWKRALFGKSGEKARRAQMNLGRLLKAREESKKSMAKRKIRKVTA